MFLQYLKPGDTVYIHPEAEYHPSTTLQKVIDAGMIPGIAINPGTSVETIYEMLRIVDKVLVMSVNPGNAGQMYLSYVGEKYKKLLPMKDTVYFSGNGVSVTELLEREKIFAGQAPEAFVLGKYLAANRALLPERILTIKGSTEPAVLAGMDISMIPGDEGNFKVTTKADLERYEGIVREQEGIG